MRNIDLIEILFEKFPDLSKEFNINPNNFNSEYDVYKLYEEYFNEYILTTIRRLKMSEVARIELKKITEFLEELANLADFKVDSLVQVGILEGLMSSPDEMWIFKSFLLPKTRELGRLANQNCKIDYNL